MTETADDPRVERELVVLRVMPRRPGATGRPADFCRNFPDGKVRATAPPGVAEMVELARRLRDRLQTEGLSVSELSRRSGIARTTIHDVLNGAAFIDVVTLARLEHTVGELWIHVP